MVSILKYIEVVHVCLKGQLARIFQRSVRRTITGNSPGGWLMVCLVIDRLLGSNSIRYRYQIRAKHHYYYYTIRDMWHPGMEISIVASFQNSRIHVYIGNQVRNLQSLAVVSC